MVQQVINFAKNMKQKDLEELLREEIRNIVIAHKNGQLTDEEYVTKMNAYNEIVKAVIS